MKPLYWLACFSRARCVGMALAVLVITLAFAPLFAIVDHHIESSVVRVDGILTDQEFYGSPGLISNGSDPISWVEVDGKRYVASEVDFNRFGDRGDSLQGRYKVGDHIEMDLFPYRPYSTWNDIPAFWMLLFMPAMAAGSFVFGRWMVLE